MFGNAILNFKNQIKRFNIVIQRLGKSLMFPIAVLPIAALLNRFGTLLSDTSIGIAEESAIWYIGKIILAPGSAVFDNIAIIFAIGCAFGLSKDFRGEAALCGGVSFFVLQVLTSKNMLPEVFYKDVLTFEALEASGSNTYSQLLYLPLKNKDEIITKSLYIFNTGVIGGITIGVVIAILYNKFYEVKLIPALSFFGGRRFVPMISILTTMGLALIFAIIWPWLQYSLISIGSWISQSSKDGVSFKSGIGAAIYILINRLMQPFGAHHILNTFLWFQFPIEGQLLDPSIYEEGKEGFYKSGDKYIVFGDIPAFAKGVIGSGIFQSGFFPTFLGAIPATGLAIIFTAKKENRKQIIALIGGAGLVSLLTGIDEPIVFIWIFLSPLLLIIHAILAAIFGFFVTIMGIRIGFGFSAGLIDYIISFHKSWMFAQKSDIPFLANPLMIWPISLIMGTIYFVIWSYIIKKLDLQTPGREKEQVVLEKQSNKTTNINKYEQMANRLVEIIGEKNFVTIENCASRLRLVLKSNDVDENQLKALGIFKVIKIGDKQLQLIIGTDVEFVANELNKIFKK